MPLTPEQKKLITDPSLFEAVEDLEKEIAIRNYESADRRTKLKKAEEDIKAFQSAHNNLIERIKKVGLNPDDEADFNGQMTTIVDKVTKDKGYKPSSEFDSLKKMVDNLTKEVTTWKDTAERERKSAQTEKAATMFDPLLTEAFGKSAHVVKELLQLKGCIVLKDGVAGIQSGDDFIPLNADKGSLSAIDHIKGLFPDLVVTKQKGGTGGASSNKGAEAANKDMVDRATFETFTPQKKMEYMQKVGNFTDNMSE